LAEYILEAGDVEFSYPDGTKALKGVNVLIEKGKKVAFLGANGAGKTTLFLHFNGILRPNRGKVRFQGRDVGYGHAALLELRKNVGIVFQDPDNQLFSASVLQEISFGPLNLGLSREETLQRVREAMAATEITELEHRPTHLLSYGQKKRVCIADVLAMHPMVMICDEPTACLDPKLARHMMELFARISREGKTVILSTHDVDLAYSWADYIYLMKDGAVAGEGKPESIFRDETLLERTGMERPWLVDMYLELSKKGWLSNGAPVPRTKEELFGIIETDAGMSQVKCCAS